MKNWREHIQAAIGKSDGKYNLADIEAKVRDKTAQVYLTDKSAAVLWVESFPQFNALVVAFGGGDLGDIIAHVPAIQAYARRVGCEQIDVYGRPGWARELKKHGFRQTAVVMSLEA